MKTNDLLVTDIQRFCMHDGPGIRTAVFLQGCPLHCAWCHNPETQSITRVLMLSTRKCVFCGACAAVCPQGAQIVGESRSIDRDKCVKCGKCIENCPAAALEWSSKARTIEDILETVERDKPFYGTEGGLTVSGGEPTFQTEGLIALLTAAKEKGFNTCLETCGVCSEATVRRIAPLIDLFLFDVKDTDPGRLKQNTGAELEQVKQNLCTIDSLGKKTVLRCVLIPTVNIEDVHAESLADLYKKLKNVQYVELLPYHPYGESKAQQAGMEQTLFPTPEKEDILAFGKKLQGLSVKVKVYGTVMQ